MDNIYKAVQLTIDSQNLALSKTPTHVYIANQYVDTNDTPLITAPFIIQKALENGAGVVDIVSSTIGSIYEVRLLCDAEVLISGYFYMPPMNAKFSELELYTSYPPRTPPVINEFWQKTENFILEKTNTLLNFVQVFNAVSSMRLSLGYLEELATTKKSNLVSAINEVYKRCDGVGDLYEKNVAAGAGKNGWTTQVIVENGLTQYQLNNLWVDVTYLLTDDATNNVAVLRNAISQAISTNKGIKVAPRKTVKLNDVVDFSGVTHIDFRAPIQTTSTVIIGGEATSGKIFDVTFLDITNGQSVFIAAIPTIDTFKISGVKGGKVRVGEVNLLRIHANGNDPKTNSNSYFTLELHGAVRALRASDEGTGGWNSRIYVHGGRLIDLDVTGTGYVPNELLFDNNTFESHLVKIRFKNARTNRVINARFEDTASAPGVIFEADAMSNTVIRRWSGTGFTDAQFEVGIPVQDLGHANTVTTQAMIEFDQQILFSIDASKILSDGIKSATTSMATTRAKTPYSDLSLLTPSLTDFTASAGRMIALSSMIPVKLGDAVIFENIVKSGGYRPLVFLYDDNKKLIKQDNGQVGMISKMFAVDWGMFTTGADLSEKNYGVSVRTADVKYMQVGIMTTSSNARFELLSAKLYIQKLNRGLSSAIAKDCNTVPLLTKEPTQGFAKIGQQIITNDNIYACVVAEEKVISAATTGVTIALDNTQNLSVDCIVGVMQTDGSAKWSKITAISGSTVTLADSVDVQVNSLLVANKWSKSIVVQTV